MAQVTIRDVAAKASVSVSVASNALNNKGRVNADTRRRVQEAAMTLGYVANYSARRLRGEGGAIGVVLPGRPEEVAHERYLSESVHGFNRMAAGLDCKLHQIFYSEESFSEAELYRVLSDGSVDGVIFLAPFLSKMETIMQVMNRLIQLPFLFFCARPPIPQMNYIDCDHYAGGAAAVRYLLELGHERIAYLMPPNWQESTNSLDMLSGIQQEMEKAGLPLYQYVAEQWRESYHLDEVIKDGVTAVIAWNDFFALRVIGGMTRRGVQIPQGMSVIGFDDESFSKWMHPSLTTFAQPLFEMSGDAIIYLMKRIKGETSESIQKTFPMQLIVRESCSVPPKSY